MNKIVVVMVLVLVRVNHMYYTILAMYPTMIEPHFLNRHDMKDGYTGNVFYQLF